MIFKKAILTTAVMAIVAGSMLGCGGGGGDNNNTPIVDFTPCNPNASENAKAVLLYLARLTSEDIPGVISGQNCGHGNEIALGTYNQFIDSLYQQSGKFVGMIGIDYEYMREFSVEELKSANTYLKSHWQNGGWVTINWSPTNPWGTLNTYEDIRIKYSGTDLNQLITPGSPVYDRWMAKLDRVAEALEDMQQAGVVVLWRPMQEANGWWFWWGKNDQNSVLRPHPSYIAVWKHMVTYFTEVKGLNNLLWVFSPTQSQSFSSFPYPGDDYVDIIGGTHYADNLTVPGYLDLIQYKKPVGLAEYGPTEFGGLVLDGSLDNQLYVQRLQGNYPQVAYWVTWHSWPGVRMALVDHQYARELMNDPYLINRGARQ